MPTNYIVFDAPLGRKHTATGKYIDFLIYLNTPLDIALARRLLRDYSDKTNSVIIEELTVYLSTSRPLYVMDYDRKEECDLIIDGSFPPDKQIKIILSALNEKKF
jgi:uridine kinase